MRSHELVLARSVVEKSFTGGFTILPVPFEFISQQQHDISFDHLNLHSPIEFTPSETLGSSEGVRVFAEWATETKLFWER